MERKQIKISEEQLREQQQYMVEVRSMTERPQSYCVVTYGCQMNAHDSEVLAGTLQQMGLKEAENREEADFVIFNTCCVRDNAERRALGNVTWLKEIKKKRPWMIIAVCGCMIQEPGMAEKIVKQYKFVDLAFGTANSWRFPELLYKTLQEQRTVVAVDRQDCIAENLPVKRLRNDAAYVNIMYGCDNFCTYCIVPYVRGRERSREVGDILRECEDLQKSGVKEIMLLGQNVNSYGKNLVHPVSFAELLKQLDETGMERIRFMTSHPKDLSDELISVMGTAKHVLPQFHLPVQSGNDAILKAMNRHYDRARYLDRVRLLRDTVPNIGLTTDIIVGFPGETEEQFLDTMSLVDEVGFDSAFTFIYSPRVGTAAANLPNQIPAEVATERIQRLIALQEKRQRERQARFIGFEDEVLVESLSKRSHQAVSGKGKYGISVSLSGSEQDIGSIVKVRITEQKNNTLVGERL